MTVMANNELDDVQLRNSKTRTKSTMKLETERALKGGLTKTKSKPSLNKNYQSEKVKLPLQRIGREEKIKIVSNDNDDNCEPGDGENIYSFGLGNDNDNFEKYYSKKKSIQLEIFGKCIKRKRKFRL
jgi:hypothetical protein